MKRIVLAFLLALASAPPAFAAQQTVLGTDTLPQGTVKINANFTELYSGKQPIDADLTEIAAISAANDDFIQRKAGAWINRTIAQLKADLALTKADVGLSNVDNTSDATKDAATATLTNKSISGLSNTLTNIPLGAATGTLPIANGGTNATSASAARTSLGLAIGTNVEAWDADLDSWATKTAPAGTIADLSSVQTFTNKSISGLTNTLTDIPLGAATGTLPIANGGTNATSASAARTSLGLAIGTNVEAWDADLDSWATKTAPAGTIADLSSVQTFTNKSISGSQITSAVATATALAANGTNCSAGNYPLGVDASGNAESCTAASAPAGSTTQIQYNNAGAFGADADLVYDASLNTLTLGSAATNGIVKGPDGATSTSAGSDMFLKAGSGGSTSGNGGTLRLVSGLATSGNGGNINLSAAAGGSSGNGGSINLNAGALAGAGTAGAINGNLGALAAFAFTPATYNIGNTTDNPNINVLGTGTFTFNGPVVFPAAGWTLGSWTLSSSGGLSSTGTASFARLYVTGSSVPSAGNAGLYSPGSNRIGFGSNGSARGEFDSSGRLVTLSGRIENVRVVTAAGAVTVATSDEHVCINKTSGAATAANLPSSPATGQTFTIDDCKGDAATNNITVTPAAGNVDGSATLVINTNYGSWTGYYTGTMWKTTALR